VHFCLEPYAIFSFSLPLHIIYLLHLLSTNHKCTQPCYFSLLLKHAAQKEKMDWNSSRRSCAAPIPIPVGLWGQTQTCGLADAALFGVEQCLCVFSSDSGVRLGGHGAGRISSK
jgi:hypothetical protein